MQEERVQDHIVKHDQGIRIVGSAVHEHHEQDPDQCGIEAEV